MSSSSRAEAGDDGVVVVLTTAGDDAAAARIARTLVDERLAACVTRLAARSVYRWDGPDSGDPVRDEEEVLLVIKTARSKCALLERRLLEIHPYEVPEIVVLEPEAVEARYRAWLLEACR
jgi:periplasmic divalent cation tolerance protein